MTSQPWAFMGSILFSLAGTSFRMLVAYPKGSLTLRKKSHNSCFSSWVRFMVDRGGWALVPPGWSSGLMSNSSRSALAFHGPWFSIYHSWVSQANSHRHSFHVHEIDVVADCYVFPVRQFPQDWHFLPPLLISTLYFCTTLSLSKGNALQVNFRRGILYHLVIYLLPTEMPWCRSCLPSAIKLMFHLPVWMRLRKKMSVPYIDPLLWVIQQTVSVSSKHWK